MEGCCCLDDYATMVKIDSDVIKSFLHLHTGMTWKKTFDTGIKIEFTERGI